MRFRIRRLPAAAALVAVTLIATACASSTAGASGGQASTSATLTVGWAEPPDTLNPATTGARDVGPIDVNVFDTLVWLTPTLKATPDLATKWSVSPDGKTYTFTLRHGVKFQDGTPFNAQSVVANVDYITAKSTQSTIALGLLGPCTTATATSAYTVAFHCAKPYAPLLDQLGEPYLGIQSPAAIARYGKNLGEHLVGTGPFKFVSYTPNQSVVLARNPAYDWAPPAVGQNGPSKIAKIVFNIVTNSQARVGSLQSGQSQLVQETPGVYYKSLASSYSELADPISGMGIFAPINASTFPTNDLAVRQAIMYAINKKSVIQLADSGVFPAQDTPFSQGMLGYDSSLANMYPYDPAKATQLLTADGWSKTGGTWTKDGKKLALTITAISTVPEYPLIAQAIQSSLQAVGMQVSVVQQAEPAWLASNLAGNMSLTPLQYIGVDPDALHLWFTPGQYYNWSHYTNPQLTKLIDEGQVTTDQSARAKIYEQAQQLIMQEAVDLPLHLNEDLLVYSKSLTGVTYSGGGFEYFYKAALS
ncbi:MAG TPA: ABC transporter substrate-binding protein [Trebonia sp.]|nr:ABC transporter substrate-binding protein [Trebonia sp.]